MLKEQSLMVMDIYSKPNSKKRKIAQKSELQEWLRSRIGFVKTLFK